MTSQDNSPAIQAHLSMTQTIIQRMATNSSSSKAWCITLVSAILVVIADKDKAQYALIAVIPVVLFLVLDTYYLALEKGFRNSYNNFIKKLHNKILTDDDMYIVSPDGNLLSLFLKSLGSFSIWPFYLALFAMVFFTKIYVMSNAPINLFFT